MAGPKPEEYGRLRERSILFGDNEWGRIVDERPEHKWRGRTLKPFLFVPAPHLVKTYEQELRRPGIRWVPTNLGDALWREYPVEWVNDRDTSRTNAIVRVYCTFDGKQTEETRRQKRYTDQITQLEEEIDHLLLRIEQLKIANKELLADRLEEAKVNAELQRLLRSGRYSTEEDEELEDKGDK